MILLAYALAAVVKGAIGVGTPLIVVPMLSAMLGLPSTVASLTFPLIVSNIWHVWEFRAARRDLSFLPVFMIGAGAGIGFGTWGLVSFDPAPIMITVGLMVLAYLALTLVAPHLSLSKRAGHILAPLTGAGSGFMQGLSGISAPISLTFLSALRLDRPQFIFAASATFLTFAFVQLVSLRLAGVMTNTMAGLSLLAAIPTLAFMPLGSMLGRRISTQAFRHVVLALLFLLALRMIYQGITL